MGIGTLELNVPQLLLVTMLNQRDDKQRLGFLQAQMALDNAERELELKELTARISDRKHLINVLEALCVVCDTEHTILDEVERLAKANTTTDVRLGEGKLDFFRVLTQRGNHV